MNLSKQHMRTIGIGLLVVTGMVAFAAISVANGWDRVVPGETLTFSEVDRKASFTHVRNRKGPERANLQGDLFASESPLVDEAGNRIGRLHLACTTTAGARNFLNSAMTCHSVADLRDGTLTAQFLDGIDRMTTGAITGGTGAYAGATGTFVSTATRTGATTTITFGE
jgi:hypothetical protein